MGIREIKRRIEQKAAEQEQLRIEGEILWAITMAAFMMAAADGRLADEEIEALARAILDIADEPNASEDDVQELLETDLQLYEKLGFDGCAREIEKRLPSKALRSVALQLAAAVAYADGHLAREEEAAYARLARVLGFTKEEAEALSEDALFDATVVA